MVFRVLVHNRRGMGSWDEWAHTGSSYDSALREGGGRGPPLEFSTRKAAQEWIDLNKNSPTWRYADGFEIKGTSMFDWFR